MEMKANVASAIKEMMAQMNATVDQNSERTASTADAPSDKEERVAAASTVVTSSVAAPTVATSTVVAPTADSEPEKVEIGDDADEPVAMSPTAQIMANIAKAHNAALDNKDKDTSLGSEHASNATHVSPSSSVIGNSTAESASILSSTPIVRPIVSPVAPVSTPAPVIAPIIPKKEEPSQGVFKSTVAPVAPRQPLSSVIPSATPSVTSSRSAFLSSKTEFPVAAYEKTVISKGTTITGDVVSHGDLELSGSVSGNVSVAGSLKLWGRVEGNVEASDFEAFAARIKGNIISEGKVIIDSGSVVSGNITATSLSLDGKLKGDVDVDGAVTVGSNGVQVGKISARQISIGQGARLNSVIQMTDESAQAIADEVFA